MKNKGRSAAAAVNVRHAYRALLARMRSNGLLAKDYTVLVVNTHLTGDSKLVADQISEWARLQTPIIRLWLLGNRARRTHSPDGDLDVAFEIESLPTNDAKDAFVIVRESWTNELSEATGLEIHFESIELEQIQTAVTDHGVLIYEHVAAPGDAGHGTAS